MIRHHRAILPWAFCLALLPAGAAPSSAADWPVARGPSNEPVPYRYDPSAWKNVPREFLEDAPACTLYAGTTYLVDGDGTIENVVHEITRFNGRKGIEALGEFRHISYNPAYEKLTLNDARIHKHGGGDVVIEPKHVQLRDLGTDYQVYQQDKQLIISFPNLEVGDVIEVKWTVRGKNPEHDGQFFTRYNFGDDTYPVVHDEMRVRLPKDRPLKYATVGGAVEPKIEEAGDTRTYHWQVLNRRQLPQDDNLPSKEELRLRLAVSTFANWEDVGRWKQRLRKDCWECTQEVREVVKAVTAGLKEPAEKARALTHWVKRNIRYLAIGETHDYTPHAPGVVLTNRFGDCKDQSQLLAVMLREAGLSVSLATLGVLDDGQVLESVPSPWGTHAILMVELPGHDGKPERHWVDTTVNHSAWDFLPFSDRDRLCYVVGDAGPLRLLRTPPFTADDNRFDQLTRVSVGADGSATCERALTYRGNAALAQRDNWLEVPVGERRRMMTDELQNAQGRARLRLLHVDDKELLDPERPVTARVVFEVPDQFTGTPDREGNVNDNRLWGKLLSFNVDPDRTVALDLWQPFESRHRFVIELPPSWEFDGLPRDKSASSKWGKFTLTVKSDPENPRRLELEMLTRLERVRVEPADLEAFHKFQDDVSKGYRVWMNLRPARDLEAAPLLEAVLQFAPEDTVSAWALAQLYDYHAKDAEARRVLKRALYYRPNDQALWDLTVTLTDTEEEKAAAQREMVKRFPGEDKYAVALGATLVSLGEFDKAAEVLQPLTEKSQSSLVRSQAWYNLARSSYWLNRFEEALERLDRSEKADPETTSTATALVFRGRIHEKLGQSKEAREAYREAVRAQAENSEALLALVRLGWTAGDKAESLDYLRRYTLAVEGDAQGLATAADWHLKMGRYDDAFDLASRSRERGFTERAQRVLGLIHLRRGRYPEAALHLAKADVDGPVLEGLIRALLVTGDFAEAELRAEQLPKVGDATPALKRLVQRVKAMGQRRKALLAAAKPADEDAWRDALAALVCAEFAHEENLAADKVDALLKKAQVGGETIGPALALRGQRSLERGRLDRALADAERAIGQGPADARGFLVRGRVRLERGTDGALADLERAAELSKRKDGLVLHWLAAGLFRSGKKEEAVKAQREAAKLRPNDAEVKEQLEEFEAALKGDGRP